MAKITSTAFGIDMDPSHIYRAGEDPGEGPAGRAEARAATFTSATARATGPGPATRRDQACGRGDIDLMGYCKAMVDGGYDGPVCLEVIGAGKYDLSRQAVIAAESYGYLNACLKALGGR